MLSSWFLWRWFIRKVAKAHGFLDPIALLARLESFAEPAEVAQPIELLRAGVIFHARGALNARVIQHNLDWLWPFWVLRQFDPSDEAFLPRAFAFSNVNLTHRSWTAVGLPDLPRYPIVDPRGLFTPHFDGWSLDGWVINDQGGILAPCREGQVRQQLKLENGLVVATETNREGVSFLTEAYVKTQESSPEAVYRLRAKSSRGGWLVVASGIPGSGSRTPRACFSARLSRALVRSR